jgi:Penicillin-insensitive murein endopeptidase
MGIHIGARRCGVRCTSFIVRATHCSASGWGRAGAATGSGVGSGHSRSDAAGSLSLEPLPPLENPNSPKTPAKELFARKLTPFSGPPLSIGGYADGCLAGASLLPIDGPSWQVMRLSRDRNWGHPNLIAFLERFGDNAKKIGSNGLLIGDMSQPRGGPMLNGHSSHQIGLDADVWFMPMPDHVQSREEREFSFPADVVAKYQQDVDPKGWTHTLTDLIHTATQDSCRYAHFCQCRDQEGVVPRVQPGSRVAGEGGAVVWSRRALSCSHWLLGRQFRLQVATTGAGRRRLRAWTRFLVQSVRATPGLAADTPNAEARHHASGPAARMQRNRNGAVRRAIDYCTALRVAVRRSLAENGGDGSTTPDSWPPGRVRYRPIAAKML